MKKLVELEQQRFENHRLRMNVQTNPWIRQQASGVDSGWTTPTTLNQTDPIYHQPKPCQCAMCEDMKKKMKLEETTSPLPLRDSHLNLMPNLREEAGEEDINV